MRIAIFGSGAVGGYYGVQLARAGHEVMFLARGAHLRAIRERGLLLWSPLGDACVHAAATSDPAEVGPVDLVLFAIKTYDNETALPTLPALCGPKTVVLTLQNGIESFEQVAGVVGEARTLAGSAYIATAVSAPGLIEQTGTHRRIVFGEVYGRRDRVSERAEQIARVFSGADIEVDVVADARVPLWEKFIYLAPFAGFTGASRRPAGAIWGEPATRDQFLLAVEEVERVARAEGIDVAGSRDRVSRYLDSIPGTMRSSLLIDLHKGKRIEVEALQGAVARRGAAHGVPTPIMSTLYAILKAASRPER